MDGRNDNAENTNGVGGSSPSGQPQIFSTPELTVNTENLPEVMQPTDNQSRIASAFAKTDATQRSQALTEATQMPVVTPIQSTATGDIVLNNGAVHKKRSKLPLLIGALVLIVAAGLIAFAIISGSSNKETALQAFTSYRDYLEKGPENLREENETLDDWFLFEIDDLSLSNEEKESYLNELQNRYDNFLNVLTSKNQKVDDLEGLRTRATEYQETLNVLTKSLSLDLLSDKLLEEYLNNGSGAAYAYVEKTSDDTTDPDSAIGVAATSLNEYLNAELRLIEIYSKHNCIEDDSINYYCASGLLESNQSLAEALEEQSMSTDSINIVLPVVKDYFRKTTERISELIGDK